MAVVGATPKEEASGREMDPERRLLTRLILGLAALPALLWGAVRVHASPAPVPGSGALPPPTQRRGGDDFPNARVTSHRGERFRLWDDLVRDHVVMVNFMSVRGHEQFPVSEHLAAVARKLGERLGREVLMLSITTDPDHDTPEQLASLAERVRAPAGWHFLTTSSSDSRAVSRRLYKHGHHGGHSHPARMVHYGHGGVGVWGAFGADSDPDFVVERLGWVQPGTKSLGRPERAGPRKLAGDFRTHNRQLGIVLAGLLAFGSGTARAEHPGPQPRPGPSTQTVSPDGSLTTVVTPEGAFPSVNPFENPPGSNFLETVDSNMRDGNGVEMPNTLPSTPANPYNLHPDPVVSEIDPTSPTDELEAAFDRIRIGANERRLDGDAVQLAIDILEGNPLPGRVWSGLPLLHYNGPEKVKRVEPIYDAGGNKIGGNVNVHQIWYDTHIEADTSFVDPSDVLDVPWTITYTVDTLNRGHEDFASFVMYVDDPALSPPGMPPMPHVAMDQTFFPMEDGTRTVYEIRMAPGKYYNLTYHWGWRIHPPRVQVIENARKVIAGKTLPQWEVDVFGESPTSSEESKLAAIDKIGGLSPAKRMWEALRRLRKMSHGKDARKLGGKKPKRVLKVLARAELAFLQWQDRSRLPDGVELDPESDVTLFYANNTIYGQMTGLLDDNQADFPQWVERGQTLKVKLLNGDYFEHAYVNVDFGGSRGWENQFRPTLEVGGAGAWFTFGRVHWWLNAGAPPVGLITVPTARRSKNARRDKVGEHSVHITYNFEPSRRLRFYQFDPLHHDVAVWSIH